MCRCRRLKLGKTKLHNSHGNGSIDEGFSCFFLTWRLKVWISIKCIPHSSHSCFLPCLEFKCFSNSDLFPLNLHFVQLEQTSLFMLWISSCLLLCLSLLSEWTWSKWVFNSSRFFDCRLQNGQLTPAVFITLLLLGHSSILTDDVGVVGLWLQSMWSLRLS